jgi:hypothetical protein
MKKTNRKVPQSVKVQRRIDAALAEQRLAHKKKIEAVISQYDQKIALLEMNSGTKDKPIVVVQNDTDFVIDKEKLAAVMQKHRSQILPLKTSGKSSGFIVENWRDSWKWITVWGSATIIGINAFYLSLPPEFIDALPDNAQSTINFIGGIALLLGRFINQSKPKALPPAENQDV